MREERNEGRPFGLANGITGCRMLCSAGLLLVSPFSSPFYALYLAAGLSDMADGAVARRTHTASEFGARLDTAADILFVAVCLVRLLPVLAIPAWLWAWTGIIAAIKAVTLVCGWRTQRKLVAVHSALNRATGLALFCLPLLAGAVELTIPASAVCALATLAAMQEHRIVRTGKHAGI